MPQGKDHQPPFAVYPKYDLLKEHLLTLAQAARRLPSASPDESGSLNPSTVFRWTKGGLLTTSRKMKVRLEKTRIGGRNFTSVEALTRFFERLVDDEPSPDHAESREISLDKQAKNSIRILRQRGRLK